MSQIDNYSYQRHKIDYFSFLQINIGICEQIFIPSDIYVK